MKTLKALPTPHTPLAAPQTLQQLNLLLWGVRASLAGWASLGVCTRFSPPKIPVPQKDAHCAESGWRRWKGCRELAGILPARAPPLGLQPRTGPGRSPGGLPAARAHPGPPGTPTHPPGLGYLELSSARWAPCPVPRTLPTAVHDSLPRPRGSGCLGGAGRGDFAKFGGAHEASGRPGGRRGTAGFSGGPGETGLGAPAPRPGPACAAAAAAARSGASGAAEPRGQAGTAAGTGTGCRHKSPRPGPPAYARRSPLRAGPGRGDVAWSPGRPPAAHRPPPPAATAAARSASAPAQPPKARARRPPAPLRARGPASRQGQRAPRGRPARTPRGRSLAQPARSPARPRPPATWASSLRGGRGDPSEPRRKLCRSKREHVRRARLLGLRGWPGVWVEKYIGFDN